MRPRTYAILGAFVILIIAALILFKGTGDDSVHDEAWDARKTPADFPQAPEDYFRNMDGGIALTAAEAMGRNTWMVWTAGNDAFWNELAGESFGAIDLLKILSSYPSAGYSRDNRFNYFGLVNEPGFRKASKPDQYGLWLDERTEGSDPFENASKYPGVNGESFYGRASGILGLRLFPNPDFNEEAKKKWDSKRYYTDRSYYYDKKLVRPYRVGVSCAFCHVSFDPVRPPSDPESPQWENLSAYIGNQYFWAGRVFGFDLTKDNFLWQWFNSSPPGALETSMIATDHINNPRTMNAIYSVGARLGAGQEEELAGNSLIFKSMESGKKPDDRSLMIKENSGAMKVPHILKDGADAIGILGALSRVYLNIGEYHKEWTRHFNILVGGKKQTPFDAKAAFNNSVYWGATADRVGNLAAYFLKAARPHHLEDAPGGAALITKDVALLTRGKTVFAENCASCHSSKQPPGNPDPKSAAYLDWMRAEALKPDFRDDNYFSTEKRYPVTLIGTNAAASLASNAIRGHVWDNFSSETYKNLPAVGAITVTNPIDGSQSSFTMPGGGRGYYRAPSLISMWASAPYFHNNALGKFTNDPSVNGRMIAFNDAVEKLLWPERRAHSDCDSIWGMPFCGPIYRTTQESYIIINRAFLPEALRPLLIGREDAFRIGPIPKGTPINLLANINLDPTEANYPSLIKLLFKLKSAFARIKVEKMDAAQSTTLLKTLVPDLLKVSKCPDFVIDRGHEFGSKLPDADKRALIEFLKTL